MAENIRLTQTGGDTDGLRHMWIRKIFISSGAWWFLTISCMGAVFYVSNLPGADIFEMPGHFDKVLHFGVYAVLACLIHVSMEKSSIRKHVFLISIFIAVLYGIANELFQTRVPGRDASMADIMANFAGAVAGSSLTAVIWAKKSFRRRT